MLPGERTIAGVSCSDVLAELSAYLDGELGAARVAQLEAHVSNCTVCASFGNGFGRMLNAMRTRLTVPEAISEDVANRLQAALPRVVE